jgi:cystathionine beta-lyase
MTIFSLTETQLRQRRSLKWRTYALDVLPLWVAEMDAPMQPAVRAELEAAFDRGDTGYPYGTEYQEAFAAMAIGRWEWSLDPARQLRRGGDVMNSILCVLESVTDPGDGIVINPPVYPPIRQVAGGYRRQVVESPLTAAGRIDLNDLERVFETRRPRAYLLCSPHNPTGTIHSAEELAAVAKLCHDFDVTLIADEIHGCLVDPGATFVPLLTVPGAERAVVVTSAGKAWNLAGFKAGLYVVGPERLDLFGKLPPLANQSTGFLGQIAHTAAMRHEQPWVDQARAEMSANKDLLVDLLHALVPRARYDRPWGTYLAWVDCRELGLADPAATFLTRGRVAFNPGVNFGVEHQQWVRINLATSPALIIRAVERMASALRATD